MAMEELSADVVIIGGGVGGCAAALAAVEGGCSVLLTEESDWLGGQFTTQITPADEHGWIERFGCTQSYRRFRQLARAYYATYYPLVSEAKADPFLNPGNAWVSPIAIEPSAAVAVLDGMFAPHVSAGRLKILRHHVPVGVKKRGSAEIASVVLQECCIGVCRKVSGTFILDATELGDLLEMAEAEHVTGQESQAQTGEPSAPETARPENIQAFTWCFTLEHIPGADYTADVPENYDSWSRYRFPVSPPWPNPIFAFAGLNPRTLQPVSYRFAPDGESEPGTRDLPTQKQPIDRTLWAYRRLLDRRQFVPGFLASDVTVVNWPMNDYLATSLIGGTAETRAQARQEARQLSLGLLHWLRTEAPRPDGGQGWPGLRTCPRITGTSDGLAKAPYIREARRIRAVTTIREQDVSPSFFPAGANRAREFEDSVGLGSYRIDLHPSTGGDNFIDVPTLPFQIPLGALIPERLENLLPAAKNIGTTHITNGCYRLHPVEWNVGEAAGALAAFCLRHKLAPRQVQARVAERERFQEFLRARGVELAWPEDLVLAEGDPHIHAGPRP